ncbi:MAG: SusD/RagB family nutrient-binding outer membrane lipoprotein, partial [Prevotellaceae bacterium]|nr:SusD/RagB family nutrient-binding outer membrane lipoprotein [Prevotellaceae bacterium]
DFNTAYTSLMSQPLADLNRIVALTASDDEQKGYYFIAEALSIFTWQIVTDVWGDMPYSEALRGNEGILHPKQDKGEDIYADLLRRIDKLLAVDLSESYVEGTYDFIYEGDLEAWVRFANSLKVKLLLRQSEAPQYSNAALLSFVEQADLLTASAKISGSTWDDSREGKRHPLREFEAGGANYFSTNVIGCKTFVDYLNENGDPRLSKLFTGGTRAAFFGDFDSKEDADGNGTTDDKESYCKAIISPDLDVMLISDWEASFHVAEVYARAGRATDAQEHYEAGVKASLEQHGISDYSIVNSGYAKWATGSVESQVKQIAMQKWVASCTYQHIESFLERNRTKYPAVNEVDIAADRKGAFASFPVGDLTISVRGRERLNGNLPASALYPEYYIFRNNNAPAQKSNIGQKVWWDKKAGK